MFGQTPSSLLEIKDWSVARELDVAAALYLYEEELKREFEREKRDRDFWIAMFGGKTEERGDARTIDHASLEAMLGRGDISFG